MVEKKEYTVPVRVLMLFTILNRGGAETMVMNYYRQIDRTKVQFDFVVHREERGAYEDEIEQLGGRIYRFMPLRPWTIPQYKKQIKQFFDEHPEYRIIHGQCSESGYYFYQEAAKRGVPVIIAHAHSSHVPFDLKLIGRTWMKLKIRPYLTHYFTCGKEAAEWLFGKKKAEKAIILPNAIDTNHYEFSPISRQKLRQQLGFTDGDSVVCHVGSFVKPKNHRTIVEIFNIYHKQQPKSKLMLIGEGILEQETLDQVKSLGLTDCVYFMGLREDVNRLLMAADVFLFPSLHEGFPLSLLEAQCSGLPCIISSTIPQETCITNLVTRLSLKESTEQWAKAIIHQSSFSCNRADYARQIAEAGYDIKKNAQWLQDFYLSCLS